MGRVGTCGVPSKARLIYASARVGVDGLGDNGKGGGKMQKNRKGKGAEERAS